MVAGRIAASVLSFTVLLGAMPASGESFIETGIEFNTPAIITGQAAVSKANGAALLGDESATLSIVADSISYWEKTQVFFSGEGGIIAGELPIHESEWAQVAEATAASLSSTDGRWGALFEGDTRISLESMTIVGSVTTGATPTTTLDEDSRFPQIRFPPIAPTDGVWWRGSEITEATTSQSGSIELFGFAGSFGGQAIANGYGAGESLPSGDRVVTITHGRLVFDGATASISTTEAYGIGLGQSVDIFADGMTLLPIVKGDPGAGEELPDGTWQMKGNTTLQNVEPGDGSRLRANLATEESGLAIDGVPVSSKSMSPAAVAATSVGALALLAVIIKAIPTAAALLTRLPPEKALENANRRTLHDYIQKHPGATFREVIRETEMAAGTARHHLTVLVRSRVIVEHGHRSTLRFFENHGKFDATWQSMVLLREPELNQVHAWLQENDEANQKHILAHAIEDWGWSRSTTQHRLARLIDGGLVTFRQAGRRKFYSAVDPAEAKPVGLDRASWT